MSENTKIEWATHTFNPWIGCTKVGPGCDNCYAKADFEDRKHRVVWGAGQARSRTSIANWKQPVKWNRHAGIMQNAWAHGVALHGGNEPACIAAGFIKPQRPRVFCASLADVFDNAVDPQWRADLFALIVATPNLDWLLLTKRIGNVLPMLAEISHGTDEGLMLVDLMPLPNVWIGATIVNQEEADRDIPKLLAVPAHKRFLSMEPLLSPVDIGSWIEPWEECGYCCESFDFETGRSDQCPECGQSGCMSTGFGSDLRHDFDNVMGKMEVPAGPGIHWVIVGGESGPNARPMHPDWARSLRDQCAAAGVPFLFKQWGEWKPISQMEESETNVLYRSKIKARPHEDQDVLNGIYGRHCTIKAGVVHNNGSLHDINEAMAFMQGTGAMTAFRVGKKAAGRLLDGVTHDGVPT